MNILYYLTFLLWINCMRVSGSEADISDFKIAQFVWFPDNNGLVHYIDLQDESKSSTRYNPDADIEYHLYTRTNPQVPQIINKRDRYSLQSSYFNKRNPVKLIIHGWTGDTTSYVNIETRIAFLQALDVNVFIVDWSKGCSGTYAEAVDNCPETGASIGDFLDWLNQVGVPFANMHVIGHSLGGQLAGFVCRSCQRGKVGYLTGLDPAHPSWDEKSKRITKIDAEYVEVIHTNVGHFGMKDPTGHNDFYPNGGLHMPGCGGNMACSHARCIDYFTESIDNQWFMGNRCATVSEAETGKCFEREKLHMGGAKAKAKIGLFALETNEKSPYYKG